MTSYEAASTDYIEQLPRRCLPIERLYVLDERMRRLYAGACSLVNLNAYELAEQLHFIGARHRHLATDQQPAPCHMIYVAKRQQHARARAFNSAEDQPEYFPSFKIPTF